jgi:hypothetical protein
MLKLISNVLNVRAFLLGVDSFLRNFLLVFAHYLLLIGPIRCFLRFVVILLPVIAEPVELISSQSLIVFLH